MSRLIFHCRDEYNHLVDFETSEHEGDDLMKSYSFYVDWLGKNGLTQIKIKSANPVAKPHTGEIQKIDTRFCPKCLGDLWDNRPKIASGQMKPNAPDFSCKNKNACGWAVWAGTYETE